jgi:hypothetical protein
MRIVTFKRKSSGIGFTGAFLILFSETCGIFFCSGWIAVFELLFSGYKEFPLNYRQSPLKQRQAKLEKKSLPPQVHLPIVEALRNRALLRKVTSIINICFSSHFFLPLKTACFIFMQKGGKKVDTHLISL